MPVGYLWLLQRDSVPVGILGFWDSIPVVNSSRVLGSPEKCSV